MPSKPEVPICCLFKKPDYWRMHLQRFTDGFTDLSGQHSTLLVRDSLLTWASGSKLNMQRHEFCTIKMRAGGCRFCFLFLNINTALQPSCLYFSHTACLCQSLIFCSCKLILEHFSNFKLLGIFSSFIPDHRIRLKKTCIVFESLEIKYLVLMKI